ncbi:Uncharacterized protein QTN25_008912 [Entamoeba marina]
MSRRLTEERFLISTTNAVLKLTTSSTGKKQFMTKSKKMIVKFVEEGRNIDAKKEAEFLIRNQYLTEIYDVLIEMIKVLSKNASKLPGMTSIPKSIGLEIRTVHFFADHIEDFKEMIEIKKMLNGQFGTILAAESNETSGLLDAKLIKKYRALNSIKDSTINSLINALCPKSGAPQKKTNDIPDTTPTLQQLQPNNSSRFPSANQSGPKFPSLDDQQNKFPSMGGDDNKFPSMGQPQQSQFPSMGNDNKFPSMDQPQQSQFPSMGSDNNKFPSMGGNDNKFPSMGQPQQSQFPGNDNKFPSMGQPQQQSQFPSMGNDNKFPSMDQPQQQSQFPSMGNDNKFPSMGQPQQSQFPSMGNDNKFPSMSQPQQSQFPSMGNDNKFPSMGQPQQSQFPSMGNNNGTFQVIGDGPTFGGLDDDDDDLLARMEALQD